MAAASERRRSPQHAVEENEIDVTRALGEDVEQPEEGEAAFETVFEEAESRNDAQLNINRKADGERLLVGTKAEGAGESDDPAPVKVAAPRSSRAAAADAKLSRTSHRRWATRRWHVGPAQQRRQPILQWLREPPSSPPRSPDEWVRSRCTTIGPGVVVGKR